jgi:hypothetical protein
MKTIYVVLIALGTGLVGFLTGGGLGLFGGGAAGAVAGAVGGMCVTVDTAVAQKLLTEAEVEQLGTRMGKNFRAKAKQNPNIEITTTDSDKLKLDPASTLCERFLNQVKLGLQQE